MTRQITGGWLYSLADAQQFHDEESNWGAINRFYSAVDSEPLKDGRIIISSRVWGKLQSTDFLPEPGDGFAFYHSTRALFPDKDRFRRKPRISAIGELLDIELDGRNVERIQVALEPELLKALKENPIVRDESTRDLFEQCGIIRGPAASLYRAPAPIWKRILDLIPKRVSK